jgi:hypothetical protein
MDVEVEGLNGKRMLARMTFFVPESQTVYVQVPPSRTALSLRFDQFRCLRLLETLIPDDLAFSSTPEINLRPRQPYQLTLQDGHELSGETVGVTETRYGCFLFPPVNERGEVQTLFVPAAQIRQTRIGQPIGLCLVDQDVVSREAVDHAAEVQDAMRSQRLGEILLSMQVVTPDALLQALERQSQMPMMRIGEALIGLNLISASQLDEALERQRSDRSVPLGTVLIRMGLVSEDDLQGALARKMGYPLVDVLHFPVEPEALKAVPPAMALRLQVLPLLHREGRLVMAMNDPTRRATLEELEFITQNKVAPVLADTKSLEDAIRSAYDRAGLLIDPGSGPIPYDGDDQDTEALLEDLEREGEVQDADDDRVIDTSDNSLVKLINNMIMEAAAGVDQQAGPVVGRADRVFQRLGVGQDRGHFVLGDEFQLFQGRPPGWVVHGHDQAAFPVEQGQDLQAQGHRRRHGFQRFGFDREMEHVHQRIAHLASQGSLQVVLRDQAHPDQHRAQRDAAVAALAFERFVELAGADEVEADQGLADAHHRHLALAFEGLQQGVRRDHLHAQQDFAQALRTHGVLHLGGVIDRFAGDHILVNEAQPDGLADAGLPDLSGRDEQGLDFPALVHRWEQEAAVARLGDADGLA